MEPRDTVKMTGKNGPGTSDSGRIGYLVPQFPGQTHIFFWREIAEMAARGHDPVLFSTRPPPPGLIAHTWSEEAMARTTYLGTVSLPDMVAALPRLPWAEIFAEARQDGQAVLRDAVICAGAAQALMRHCRVKGIRHVHVHSCGRAAMIARFSNALGGPSYSLTLHGPLQDYGPAQRLKWRHASFATVITRKLMAEIEAKLAPDLPPRVVLRPMGVDSRVLRRDAPYAPVDPDAPLRVFSCARLNIVKGHQDLIRAVAVLRDAGRNVVLEIAGEDDAGGSGYRAELAALIAELGVQDSVSLLGAVDAETVKAKLLSAHVFALASWSEPLGVAYMEAIACGVPTVATDAGGVPEMITHEVEGLLVPPRDPAALADAITRIADDPELAKRLSQEGRARIERDFSAHLGAQTLIEEVEHLLSRS